MNGKITKLPCHSRLSRRYFMFNVILNGSSDQHELYLKQAKHVFSGLVMIICVFA